MFINRDGWSSKVTNYSKYGTKNTNKSPFKTVIYNQVGDLPIMINVSEHDTITTFETQFFSSCINEYNDENAYFLVTFESKNLANMERIKPFRSGHIQPKIEASTTFLKQELVLLDDIMENDEYKNVNSVIARHDCVNAEHERLLKFLKNLMSSGVYSDENNALILALSLSCFPFHDELMINLFKKLELMLNSLKNIHSENFFSIFEETKPGKNNFLLKMLPIFRSYFVYEDIEHMDSRINKYQPVVCEKDVGIYMMKLRIDIVKKIYSLELDLLKQKINIETMKRLFTEYMGRIIENYYEITNKDLEDLFKQKIEFNYNKIDVIEFANSDMFKNLIEIENGRKKALKNRKKIQDSNVLFASSPYTLRIHPKLKKKLTESNPYEVFLNYGKKDEKKHKKKRKRNNYNDNLRRKKRKKKI